MKNVFRLLAALMTVAGPTIAERVDNVLAQMVPGDTQTLSGMRMEQLKQTPLFQKLVAQEKIPQLDEFARESGFDPRRDVRDVLLAHNGKQTVMLARGNFHLNLPPTAKKVNYHGFVIVTKGGPVSSAAAGMTKPPSPSVDGSGFCILDATLAAAGPLPILEAALDQYKSGNKNNAAALLARARAIPEQYQFWGVTSGGGNFISQNLPGGPGPGRGPGGFDISRIFRTLQNVTFMADLRKGLKGTAEGYCGSPEDAKTFSDALRGAVGMGRLNTPENQPELLRLWDGIKVELADKKVTLNVDISQDLIDQLVKQVQHNPMGRK